MAIVDDDGKPVPWGGAEDPLDQERILAWHDHETYQGRDYPVLWYRLDGQDLAVTEPCIWCGRRHHHGDLEGSRVPHCGDHTHELTPAGNRRRPYTYGVTRCPYHHRDYILRRRTA